MEKTFFVFFLVNIYLHWYMDDDDYNRMFIAWANNVFSFLMMEIQQASTVLVEIVTDIVVFNRLFGSWWDSPPLPSLS